MTKTGERENRFEDAIAVVDGQEYPLKIEKYFLAGGDKGCFLFTVFSGRIPRFKDQSGRLKVGGGVFRIEEVDPERGRYRSVGPGKL